MNSPTPRLPAAPLDDLRAATPSCLLEPPRVCALLGEVAPRFDVDAIAQCDSSNAELMRRAERGAASGTVLVADAQSAGRGRLGRSWVGSPADSLMFSLLWRLTPDRLPGLSLVVGLAVAEALAGLGAQGLGLKWPNDLIRKDGDGQWGKVGGILVETSISGPRTLAVLGIGLNLRAPQGVSGQLALGLDGALPDGSAVDRHQVLAACLASLATCLDRFTAGGFGVLRPAWESWHAWQGQAVRLFAQAGGNGESVAGRCVGVDDGGALLLAGADGDVSRHFAGELSIRPL